MKYNMTFRIVGMVLNSTMKNEVIDRMVRKNIQKTDRDAILQIESQNNGFYVLGL